jgi:hypothetical protein
MATPEFQSQQADPRGVSVARLISSEFGTAESVVRQQLDHQQTFVSIDGALWQGDKRFIPRDQLRGRKLVVQGPERTWTLKYPENDD